MKTLVTAVFALIVLALNIYPQDKDVQNIVEYCYDLDSRIEFEGVYLVHSIKFETNRRAIGIQNTEVKFYYPYPSDSIVGTYQGLDVFVTVYKTPVLVSIQYNIAASQNILIEYYFGNDGNLVFYYMLTKGAYTCGEEKYFFKNDELLKITREPIENCADKDGNLLTDFVEGKYKNYMKDKDFTRHDLFLAGNISKNSKKYLKMFDELVKLEEIDK